MYLVDTNVWLESILDQERAEEVRSFMRQVEGRLLAITEFSIYSVGITLSRLKKREACSDFLMDTVEDSGLLRIRLDTSDLLRALEVCERFRLDFDDAYQYVAAEKHDLTLVSFDADFDRTDRGRKKKRPRTCLVNHPLPATSRRRSLPALEAASGESNAVSEYPEMQSEPPALTGVESFIMSPEFQTWAWQRPAHCLPLATRRGNLLGSRHEENQRVEHKTLALAATVT